MNKKFAALLIPLLLMPLASYGYAHMKDTVEKRYKIHVGSVVADVLWFHVDNFTACDVNNNGKIMGDEINITIYEDVETCKFIVEITADPVPGGFVLNTTMKIHNSGKLPWDLYWAIYWDGPHDADPCFLPMNQHPANDDITELPGVLDPKKGPWSWDMTIYHDWVDAAGAWHRKEQIGTTTEEYKPCHNATIVQHVNFRQWQPGDEWTQKDWECKWIRIYVVFDMRDTSVYKGWSWTWDNGTITEGIEKPVG